jgi:hypothetical protein
LRLLQSLQHWLHIGLKLVCIFIVNCFFLVVGACIVKDLDDIDAEFLLRLIDSIIELLEYSLEIHGFLDNGMIVRDLLGIYRFLERPRILMIIQCLQYILALLLKRLLLSLSITPPIKT